MENAHASLKSCESTWKRACIEIYSLCPPKSLNVIRKLIEKNHGGGGGGGRGYILMSVSKEFVSVSNQALKQFSVLSVVILAILSVVFIYINISNDPLLNDNDVISILMTSNLLLLVRHCIDKSSRMHQGALILCNFSQKFALKDAATKTAEKIIALLHCTCFSEHLASLIFLVERVYCKNEVTW